MGRTFEQCQPAALCRKVDLAIAACRDAADPGIAEAVRRGVRDPVLVLDARRAVRRADPHRSAWLERDAGNVIGGQPVALRVGLERRRVRARGEREKEEREKEKGKGEKAERGLGDIKRHGLGHIVRNARLGVRTVVNCSEPLY